MFPGLSGTVIADKQINEVDSFKENTSFEASSRYYALQGSDMKSNAITCVPVGAQAKFGLRQPRVKAPGHSSSVILFSPYSPSTLFVATSDGQLSIFDLPETKLNRDLSNPAVKKELKEEIKCAAYHPLVKDLIVLGLRSGKCQVYDKTLSEPLAIYEHTRPLNSVAWSDDGKLLFALYADMLLKVFDARTKECKCETKVAANRGLGYLCTLPGRRVLVSFTSSGKQELRIYDENATSLATRQVGVNGTPLSVKLHWTGLIIACANRDTKLYVIDSNTLQDVCVYVHSINIIDAVCDYVKPDPDGNVLMQCSILNTTNCISRVNFTLSTTPIKFPPFPIYETDVDAKAWLGGNDGTLKTEELVPTAKPVEVVQEVKKELGPQTFYKYLKCDSDPPSQYVIDMPVGQAPNPEFNEIVCNGKEFAFIGNSKTPQIFFLPLGRPGKFPQKVVSQITSPHGSGINTMSYSPHNDRIFVSGGEDCKVKLWNLPNEWVEPLHTPVTSFNHTRKVTIAKFSENTNHLLMTATAHPELYLWDLNNEKQIRNFSSLFQNPIQDAVMNEFSSQIYSIQRDGKLMVFDPRVDNPEVQSTIAHPTGGRHRRLLNIPDFGYIASFGSNTHGERELCLWDKKDISKPIKSVEFDRSSGSMIPMYEEGAGLIYLGGKGDGHVVFVELCHDDRIIASRGAYETSEPERGLCLLPRKVCDVMNCECSRMLKLCTESLRALHWRVLRSHNEFFQDMIYPPVRDFSKPLGEIIDWENQVVESYPLYDFQPPNTKKYSEVMHQFHKNAPRKSLQQMQEEDDNRPMTIEDIVALAPEISSDDESDEDSGAW